MNSLHDWLGKHAYGTAFLERHTGRSIDDLDEQARREGYTFRREGERVRLEPARAIPKAYRSPRRGQK